MTNHYLKAHVDHYLGKGRSLLLVRRNKLPYRNCDDCYGKSDVAHRNSCECLKKRGMCHGFHASSTDPEVLDHWLNKKKMAVGLAQATGKPSGVFVVDVDQGGVEELQELLKANNNDWPMTEVHLSHKGLPHYVFQMPDGMDVRNHIKKLAPNIDIKGTGGYDILPPSKGSQGVYKKLVSEDPLTAPEWLLDKIREWQKPKEIFSTASFDPNNIPPETPRRVKKAIAQWMTWIIESPDGLQNQRIFVASRKMFSLVNYGLLHASDADSFLLEAAMDGNHPDHRALLTINSGSRSAQENPYSIRELLGPTDQERADEYIQSALKFFS